MSTPDFTLHKAERLGFLIGVLAKHKPAFFLRQKSNLEWEAGWGQIATAECANADTALDAIIALHAKCQP